MPPVQSGLGLADAHLRRRRFGRTTLAKELAPKVPAVRLSPR
jgi:hypothetical protein